MRHDTAWSSACSNNHARSKEHEPRVQTRKNLYQIMGVMRDVRVRDERTQAMFAPLKETVTLLKAHGVPVRDETLSQLDDGPIRWKALDKKKKQRTEALNAKVRACVRSLCSVSANHSLVYLLEGASDAAICVEHPYIVRHDHASHLLAANVSIQLARITVTVCVT